MKYSRTSHSMEDEGKTFDVYARGVADLLKYHGKEGMSVEDIKKEFPFVVESHEVPYLDRVYFQSIMQEYVDNAISSTVNLPKGSTAEDIYKIYMEAWKHGLKGITVFVDGCKRGNILGVDKKKKEGADQPELDTISPATRRGVKKIDGSTVRESTSCVKSLYITINKTPDGKAFECFTNASGGCKTNINTISRLISLGLRSGIKVERIVDELRANQCPACQVLRRQGRTDIALSCSNAIADAIEDCIEIEVKKDDATIKRPCPDCGKMTLIPEGKCVVCSNCGYNACE